MPENTTLFLLHGAGVDHNWWHPQTAALSATFDVCTPDLPGHGARAAEPFRFNQVIADLHATVEENNAPKVVLVGISLAAISPPLTPSGIRTESPASS